MKSWLALLNTRAYWLAIALLGLALLIIALYYQHALGEEPCQVCVQIRLWVVAITGVGLLMVLMPRRTPSAVLGNALLLGCCLGLLERSWLLYQLENGRGNGSCEFQLGMPDWFAVDRWFPEVFEVRNLCSFTPELFWGVSMAEGLVAIALFFGGLAAVSMAAVGPRHSRDAGPHRFP